MDLDSPLNLAHRCHRKAEYYLNDHRFKEAIDYHLRAANHLNEALMTTSCDKMKASLETQKAYHLSQEKVLKQREICETQKILNYKQELLNRQHLREKFGYSSDTNTNQNQNTNFGTENNSETKRMDNKNTVMTEILDVMSEHDSLLQFLIDKRSTDELTSTTETLSTNESAIMTSNSSDSLYKSGAKKPKDDKIIIEELQTVNEKLRQLVFQLFGELETSQKENFVLKADNQRLRDENRQALNSVVPELPPLEPPALLY